MMDTAIDRELLEKIADMLGKPVGAFNIRKDSGCDGRQSTEHIQITSKEDKPGIDIRIQPGTTGETCHIPVIITKPGIRSQTKFPRTFCPPDCISGQKTGCRGDIGSPRQIRPAILGIHSASSFPVSSFVLAGGRCPSP